MARRDARRPYEVEIRPAAERELAKILKADRAAARRIDEAILGLADEPRPQGSSKLEGAGDSYRVRVGDYRVVYAIDDRRRVVTVRAIGHRRDIYRGG